jgi:hypothetical protein
LIPFFLVSRSRTTGCILLSIAIAHGLSFFCSMQVTVLLHLLAALVFAVLISIFLKECYV